MLSALADVVVGAGAGVAVTVTVEVSVTVTVAAEDSERSVCSVGVLASSGTELGSVVSVVGVADAVEVEATFSIVGTTIGVGALEASTAGTPSGDDGVNVRPSRSAAIAANHSAV